MQLSANIVQSFQIVINLRWMVILGLVTGGFGATLNLFWLFIRLKFALNPVRALGAGWIFPELPNISSSDVIAGTIFFILTATVLWLVATLAESTLIVTAQNAMSEASLNFSHAIKAGWQHLGRFIGVDTILFFPLGLLVMLPLLIATGSLAGLAWQSDGISGQQIIIVAGIVLLVVTILICLIIFLTLLILLWRMLAFRAVVMKSLNPWRAILQSWQLGRQHLGEIMIVGLFLFLCRYLVSLPFQILGLLSFLLLTLVDTGRAIIWVESDRVMMIFVIIWLIFMVITLLVKAFLNAFASTLWTLSYREWCR